MAGIFGVWDPVQPRREESFQELIKDAKCGFEFDVKQFTRGEIVCGTALKPVSHPNLVISPDRKHLLMIQGEVVKLGDDPRMLEQLIEQCAKDPVLALDQVDGAYAGVLIDLNRNSLTLFADQFANFVLHYYYSERRIIFATQSSAIARALNSPIDEDGLLEYLSSGQNFESRTIYRDVHHVRPGEIVQLTARKHTSRFFAHPDYRLPKVEATVNELSQTLCEGIASRIEGKRVVAGLSGGMDTRLVWSGILSLNARVTAHTHGSNGSRDLLIGKLISSSLKLPSSDLRFSEEFVEQSAARAEHIVGISEGALRLSECFIRDIWEHLGAKYDLLLDGHGGALYSRQSMKAVGLKVRTLAQLEAAWRPRLLSALIRSDLVRPELRVSALEKFQRSLLAELNKYDGIGSIQDIIDIFNIRDLGWRPSLSGNAQINYLGMHHPLLTRDLSRLAARVPISKKLQHWVHRSVIKQLAPQLTGFAVDNDGLPATFTALPFTRMPAIMYERILSRFAPRQVKERMSLLRPTNTAAQMLWPQAQRLKQRISELPEELSLVLRPGAQEHMLSALQRGDEGMLMPASLLVSAAIKIEQAR